MYKVLFGSLALLIITCMPFSALAVPNGVQNQDNTSTTYWIYGTTNNWYVCEDTICCKRLDVWCYYMLGNTIEIEGKTYSPICCYPMDYPTASVRKAGNGNEDKSYALAVRREGGRVYVNYKQYIEYIIRLYDGEFLNPSFGNPDYIPYHKTADGELILYDYNMKVGDRFCTVEGYDDIWVAAKDSVLFSDGKQHCRLTLSNGIILIDGIGCINSNGRLFDYLNPAEQYRNNYTYLKLVCDDNGNKIYEDSITKVKELEIAGVHSGRISHITSSLYDLQGRRLSKEPAHGVYIQNGRKRIK